MLSIYRASPYKRTKTGVGGGSARNGGGGGSGSWTLVGREPAFGNPDWPCPRNGCQGYIVARTRKNSNSQYGVLHTPYCELLFLRVRATMNLDNPSSGAARARPVWVAESWLSPDERPRAGPAATSTACRAFSNTRLRPLRWGSTVNRRHCNWLGASSVVASMGVRGVQAANGACIWTYMRRSSKISSSNCRRSRQRQILAAGNWRTSNLKNKEKAKN